MALGIDDLLLVAIVAGTAVVAAPTIAGSVQGTSASTTSSSTNQPSPQVSIKTYPNEQNPPLIYDPIVNLLPNQAQIAGLANPINSLSTTQNQNGTIIASNTQQAQTLVQSNINNQQNYTSSVATSTATPALVDYLNTDAAIANEIKSQHLGSFVPVPGTSTTSNPMAYGLTASGSVVPQPVQTAGGPSGGSINSINPSVQTGTIQEAASAYIGPGYYQSTTGAPSYIASYQQYQNQVALGYLGGGVSANNPTTNNSITQTGTYAPVVQPSNPITTSSTTSTTTPNIPTTGTTTVPQGNSSSASNQNPYNFNAYFDSLGSAISKVNNNPSSTVSTTSTNVKNLPTTTYTPYGAPIINPSESIYSAPSIPGITSSTSSTSTSTTSTSTIPQEIINAASNTYNGLESLFGLTNKNQSQVQSQISSQNVSSVTGGMGIIGGGANQTTGTSVGSFINKYG